MTTRADLSRVLTLDPSAPTKTFVVEVHPEAGPEALLAEIAGRGNMYATDEAYLYRVVAPEENNSFWVINSMTASGISIRRCRPQQQVVTSSSTSRLGTSSIGCGCRRIT
jgi:hypothetical protein